MSYSNKVVLITCGTSAIGVSTASLFAKEGANIAIVGTDKATLDGVAEECERVGKKVLVINKDVSLETEAKTIVKETVVAYGRLDILVNNTEVLSFEDVFDWQSLEEINLRAIIHIATLAAPHLIESKGSIVNVSSIAMEMSPPTPFMDYSLTLSGLNQFTRDAAQELATFGVRVNSISTGPVVDDNEHIAGYTWEKIRVRTADYRKVNPEKIADLVLFLASENAKDVNGSYTISYNGMLLGT